MTDAPRITLSPDKAALRARLRAQRRAAHADFLALGAGARAAQIDAMAEALRRHLPATPAATSAATPAATPAIVASYCAVASEIDPAPLEGRLRSWGHAVALPRIVAPGQPLAFHIVAGPDPGPDQRRLGPHGIPEPDGATPAVRPDVLLVPLVGVDVTGHRLGQGGGYYDRTLAALRQHGAVLAIGLAYEAQIIPLVAEPHDQPLDAVLTPTRWIDCRQGVGAPEEHP